MKIFRILAFTVLSILSLGLHGSLVHAQPNSGWEQKQAGNLYDPASELVDPFKDDPPSSDELVDPFANDSPSSSELVNPFADDPPRSNELVDPFANDVPRSNELVDPFAND